MEKTFEDVRNYTEKVAKAKGWELNPDQNFRSSIQEGLLSNFNRHGRLYCPCRDVEGEPKDNRDILCPCPYAVQDIQEYGQCFCGLFVRPGFGKNGEEVTSIPERRPSK